MYAGASDGVRGGDIYYFSVCESGTITRIALADVVGHGNDVSEMSQWMYHALATSAIAAWEPSKMTIESSISSISTEKRHKANIITERIKRSSARPVLFRPGRLFAHPTAKEKRKVTTSTAAPSINGLTISGGNGPILGTIQ